MSENQSPRVVQFLQEIDVVCRKFGFSISHEDGRGSFLVVPYSPEDADWLGVAVDQTSAKDGGS